MLELDLAALKPEEITYIPDIGNNLELPKGEQFRIVLINQSVLIQVQAFGRAGSKKLLDQGANLMFSGSIDEIRKNLSDHISGYIGRLENPPMIRGTDGKSTPMVVDDLFSGECGLIFDKILVKLLAKVTELLNLSIEEIPDKVKKVAAKKKKSLPSSISHSAGKQSQKPSTTQSL